jgi:general secretion pathway protein G
MLVRQTSRRSRRAGFTLMEMLVVVAIIVALAGIGGFFLLGALGDAKRDLAQTQAKGALTSACTTYSLRHNGDFPDSLDQLLVKDAAGGPYLESADALADPWGQRWQYDKTGPMNNGTKPDIWTSDPKDPQRAKIGNWPKSAQNR